MTRAEATTTRSLSGKEMILDKLSGLLLGKFADNGEDDIETAGHIVMKLLHGDGELVELGRLLFLLSLLFIKMPGDELPHPRSARKTGGLPGLVDEFQDVVGRAKGHDIGNATFGGHGLQCLQRFAVVKASGD
jgi:hypothetical protein